MVAEHCLVFFMPSSLLTDQCLLWITILGTNADRQHLPWLNSSQQIVVLIAADGVALG